MVRLPQDACAGPRRRLRAATITLLGAALISAAGAVRAQTVPPVTPPATPAQTVPPVTPPATPVQTAPPAAPPAPVQPAAPPPATTPAGTPAAPAVPPAPAKAAPAPPAAPVKKADPAPEDPEVKEGREATEQMLKSGLKLVKDPDLVARVDRIGKKLAAVADVTPIDATYGSAKLVPYEYHFYIVDDPDVNAFSLPGGYIFINKGLMNYIQSDDELASVIGHEITHAAHHHVIKLEKEQSKLNTQMLLGVLAAVVAKVPAYDAANLMQGFQLLAIEKVNGFGQNAEKDADHGGIIIAAKAGYNPVGMLTFMERLERDQRMRPDLDLGIFRTHPPEKERVASDEAQLKEMGIPIRRRLVTNMLKIEVKNVPAGKDASGKPLDKLASQVLLDGSVLYVSSSQDRAKTAASDLDKLLDDDIQLYDVTRHGNDVMVRGQTVFSITAEDIGLPGSLPTQDEAATASYKQLRNVLFRELIANANPN